MSLIPGYEESDHPTLPGLFMRTDQLDSVVQVRNWHGPHSPGAQFGGSSGTGVLIGPRLVLTAKHVVSDRSDRGRSVPVSPSYLDVSFSKDLSGPPEASILPVYNLEIINPGVGLELMTVSRDSPMSDLLHIEHADLALLLIGGVAPSSPIPLAASDPLIGDRLQLSGFGQMAIGMNTRGWAEGTVSHFVDDRSAFITRSTGSYESGTSPGPGDSGGPAISRSPGGSAQVCGIVTGGGWLFKELERTRQEVYVSTSHYRDWIQAASRRLLEEDWQHERAPVSAESSSSRLLIIGGLAVLVGIGIIVALGGKR